MSQTIALIVRYGATGTGEDTWFNENATIEVKIERNSRTANCYAKYV